ncbi:MAG: BamA/TamA family outer membrane protein [Flavipsychrobacter sp.]|nr:BamA/TamA family outer membrane protein [Flavipsychrobacter sp.]
MPLLLLLAWTSCNTTKHLTEEQHLLRNNSVNIKSPQPITRRGELNDNLERLVAQKPNNRNILGIPFKLLLYNYRYEKYQNDPTHFQLQSKTVEPPVIYDSTLIPRAVQNMRGYLYNQGYFYSKIDDTTLFKGKKAYVTYNIETGINYLINKVKYDISDSLVNVVVQAGANESLLKEGEPYTKATLDDERRRITNLLLDKGFYKFTNDNIAFLIDTFNKEYLSDIDNPFESAINFVALQKEQKKPTLDVKIIIRPGEDPGAFKRYAVSRVTVYPDFIDVRDVRDSTMIQKKVNNTLFKYHDYYISEKVLYKYIYLERGRIYSQADYNETINKLNELGIFSSINIYIREDTSSPGENLLICGISMNRAKKHDFNTNVEFTSGTTYRVGSALSLSFRDKNVGRGANLLRTSVSGGLEYNNNQDIQGNALDRLYLRTVYYGFNASMDFPKFIVPFKLDNSRRNLPRTILSFGTNLMDRVNYFRLFTTSSAFAYSWRETATKSWEATPAFINIIRLPYTSDSFRKRLLESQFLANSYRESFIEGENVAFIFSNREKNRGKSYTYLRVSLEESGALLTAIQSIGRAIEGSFNLDYYQYVKFDFDLQRFVMRPHSQIAARFYGGIGVPYRGSSTLPYIKQYFAGGAYSMRGWRVRSLGPGSSRDTSNSAIFIDRTGDIKLEMNGEYRYDIVRLFSGAINVKGALFADAGNIWLANKSSSYPGGEFALHKLGKDIAIDAGTGIRLDIAGFFLVRLDLAIPLKKPYIDGNNGWVLRQMAPFDATWRSNNMILNFAIGYPF